MAYVVDEAAPHLGGNFGEGDPLSFCPTGWRYIIDRFAISSVLDLGSGSGHAADWFHRQGLKTLAVDGLLTNVRSSVYPSLMVDLTKDRVTTNVDLVHCQEVVEHIEEQFLDNLLASLACGRVVVMTHALPGQEGHHHVNCQPVEYWVAHLDRVGYKLMLEDSNRLRAAAGKDGAVYMVQSGLVFHRK
jgi:hypothetical protein